MQRWIVYSFIFDISMHAKFHWFFILSIVSRFMLLIDCETLIYKFEYLTTEGHLYCFSYFGVGLNNGEYNEIKHYFKLNFQYNTSDDGFSNYSKSVHIYTTIIFNVQGSWYQFLNLYVFTMSLRFMNVWSVYFTLFG